MNVQRLDSALQELAAAVEFPPTPPLASAVREQIENSRADVPIRLFPGPRWHRPAIAVAALVVAFAATLTFSPSARQAVADFLGVAGIRIDVEGGEAPVPTRTGINAGDLGERVHLGTAQDFVDFDIKHPARFDPAPEVYLDRSVKGGRVSFFVGSGTGEQAYVTQFVADLEESFFKKVDVGGGEIEFPTVNGTPGYWVSGAHAIFYVSDGEFLEDTLRLSGPVLLWEKGGVTYRIEGAGSLAEALELASSLE